MNPTKSARLRDPLSRFYSAAAVGRVVAASVPDPAPKVVVDLGSGSGVLAAAASARWPGARVTTVDVDPSALGASIRLGLEHVDADIADPGLPAQLGEGGADVVLSNPPFGGNPPASAFEAIMAASGLGAAGNVAPSLEMLFAAQALRLAKPGGTVVLVLSDGFATGRRSAPVRRALLASHRVVSVTQMPAGSFRGTEARGFVLTLVKDAPPADGVVLRRNDGGVDHPPIRVQAPEAAERLDHGFHAAMRSGRGGVTLEALGASIVRGSAETRHAGLACGAVFHTKDFPVGDRRRSVSLRGGHQGRPERGLVVAERGDVLVARLGRGLEHKVCLVVEGWAVPTSAVLRVRMPAGGGDAVAEALLSREGAIRLAGTARGTGARMLGRADLLAMPLPL